MAGRYPEFSQGLIFKLCIEVFPLRESVAAGCVVAARLGPKSGGRVLLASAAAAA